MALPPETYFSYLAEGAANVVYRIQLPHLQAVPPPSITEEYEEYEDDESQPTESDIAPDWLQSSENKLLRVRKDLPTTQPCESSHHAWLSLIAPMFEPDQIVQQSLVSLRAWNIIDQLNKELRRWDQDGHRSKLRPSKRRGVYLADDEYGLLVDDMTSQNSTDAVVEFKPKWLSQSPSAPKDAKRCRQCAYVAQRNAKRAGSGKPPTEEPCPLDLISVSKQDRIKAARLILPPQESQIAIARMTEWLASNSLLSRLRGYQNHLDKNGPLVSDVNDENFQLAMTLRDCTVFMRIRGGMNDPNSAIEARLGDLDLKSKEKRQYWVDTEKALINEGWYMATELETFRQPNNCHICSKQYQT
ncbi:inositol-pentakisphosphate 2-kinase [Calycina marina]|uniref:Inositol-pentakisphosphate 2-kinase n=1 Tax=Calycina marina TaxID=1763456 RepID=A0A9P8CEA4_9HELO|nr:inositol-pentakisphosphate 2-kinase [Calycina marina]